LEVNGGASPALRRILIDKIRMGRAFWWLPSGDDPVYLQRAPSGKHLAMIRPLGPFWEWIPVEPNLLPVPVRPDSLTGEAQVLVIESNLLTGMTSEKSGWLGMFEPTESQKRLARSSKGEAVCALRFTSENLSPHPGYPPPMGAHAIKI